MHTDLSPHLHTHECNEIIKALNACHEENRYMRFLGACNTFDKQMTLCCKRERLKKRDKNYEDSLKRTAIIHERLRKLKTEGNL